MNFFYKKNDFEISHSISNSASFFSSSSTSPPKSYSLSNTKSGRYIKDLKAAVVGAIFGVFSSYVVTHTLLEITFNPFFSFIFTVLFLSIGGLVAYRASRISKEETYSFEVENIMNSNANLEEYKPENIESRTRTILFCFSFLIFLCALFSLVVNKRIFFKLNYIFKIPMYSLIGTCLTFLLTFSTVDFWNFIAEIKFESKNIVHSSAQICALIIGSSLVGFAFGLFYGVLDVDDGNSIIKMNKERFVCMPIAVIIGCLTAVITNKLGYKKLSGDNVSDWNEIQGDLKQFRS